MRVSSRQKPDIFLLIVDSLRYDYYLRYGFEYIKEFNPVFLKGISPSTWTLPSYISIFFGKEVHEHNVWNFKLFKNNFKLKIIKPFVYWLNKVYGYETYMLTSNPWVNLALKRYFMYSYDIYPGKNYKIVSYAKHMMVYNDDIEKIFEILDSILENKDKPVFVNINLMLAHEPYTPIDGAIINTLGCYAFTRTAWRKLLAIIFKHSYYKHVRIVGKVIRNIIKKIYKSNNNNTYIIITSDHGQLLGEYGLVGHGWLPVKELIEVPFVVISKHDESLNADINRTGRTRRKSKIIPIVKLNKIIINIAKYRFLSTEYLYRVHKGIIISEVKEPGYCQGLTNHPYYVALVTSSTYKIVKTNNIHNLIKKINNYINIL